MDWIEYSYEFRVRFRDTDAYGMVHHSNFFCYFEEARYEFSKNILKLFESQAGRNLKFPVILAECTYKNALCYDLECCQVKLKFRVTEGIKVEFLYEIRKKGNAKIYAKGRTVHAVINEDGKLCVTLPSCLQNLIEGSGKYV